MIRKDDFEAREQGFTLIELLVVIAIISVIAGFLVPVLWKGREEAIKLECSNNLQQIYAFAMSFSDKSGTGRFPLAEGKSPRAHESLNELIRFDPDGLVPKLFVCGASDNRPAAADADGRYVLAEDTLSYAWTAKRLKNTAFSKPLASDKYVEGYEDSDGKHEGHRNGMNVLMTDKSVQWIKKSDLPEDTMLPAGLTQ